MSIAYIYLVAGILAEVIGTSALKASEEFTRWLPSVIAVTSYAVSLYFLALTIRSIPLGVTYAAWSGLGVILISGAGILLYKQTPDLPALLGMAMIIGGIIVIHLFSKTVQH